MHDETGGRLFRDAWISGVKQHHPGTPKDGYIAPWEEMAEWERNSASAVFGQVREFITATDGKASSLTRLQKGQFISLCWLGQVFKHFPDPKPSYVADWDALPEWQQQTDMDVFEAIDAHVKALGAVGHLR